MNNSRPFNLFSRVGQKSKRASSESKLSPLSSESGQNQPFEADDELKQMVDQMKSMYDELNRKIEEAYQKTGWSHQYIKKFLENPNNFTSIDWQNTQGKRKKLLSTIWNQLGKGDYEQFQAVEKKKEVDKAVKDRKAKTLGARRNWISIK